MAEVVRKSTIVGSSFYQGAGEMIMRLRGEETLWLKREPANKYDANAIQVGIFSRVLGYVPRGLAAELAPKIDAGVAIVATKIPIAGAAIKLTYDEPEVVPPVEQRFSNLELEEQQAEEQREDQARQYDRERDAGYDY